MIIEGIVTTLDPNNQVNVAPMGPIVDDAMTQLILRPFQSSTTYQNLKQRPYGVFHVVDDVLLIAQAALDQLPQVPPTFTADRIKGMVLSDCCRWYEFEIVGRDESSERASFTARIVHTGRLRDMFGFNRAKHAVLEATILATRVHLIPELDVRTQIASLAIVVEKTAGPRERQAFELVKAYVDVRYQDRDRKSSGE